MIENDLAEEQIDLEFSFPQTEMRSGFAHVWIDATSGKRMIAASRPKISITPDHLQSVPWNDVAVLHLDGWPPEAAIAAAKRVKQNGGMVFLDAGTPKAGFLELVEFVDVINCPIHLFDNLGLADNIDAAVQMLKQKGPQIVTVTNGQQGATIFSQDEKISRPAFLVDVVDTTGAGDVFVGGLIHAVLDHWELPQILDFAMASAALKCRQLGNRDSLPQFDEIIEFAMNGERCE